MVRFLKAVNTFDKVTDCIPVISTVKNIGILLYQLVHKVNKTANPVNTSWTDDIKIHVLSKDSFMAKVCMVPIIGNLAALVTYVKYASKGMFTLFRPMGYLAEASRQWNDGAKKHGHEITALYLARNPNRSEKSLGKALSFAVGCSDSEVYKLIFNSRVDWSADSICKTLRNAKRVEDVQYILDRSKEVISNKIAGSIVSHHTYRQSGTDVIKLLLDTFPKLSVDDISSSLEQAAGREKNDNTVALLLQRFPNIDQVHIDAALKKAAEAGIMTQVEMLLAHSAGSNVGIALHIAASKGNVELCNWLLETHADKITTADVGKALSAAVQPFYPRKDDKHLLILDAICKECQDLPAKDLERALSDAASHNVKLFQIFLNYFSKIQAENVQVLLNKAVLYSSHDDHTAFSKDWAKVAELIRAKFPGIKASEDLF